MKLYQVVSMKNNEVKMENIIESSKKAITQKLNEENVECLKVKDISNTVFTNGKEEEITRFNIAITNYTDNEQLMLKEVFIQFLNDLK